MTHGKGKDFKPLPPIAPEKINGSYLQLLLFESERAWAYAQELMELYAKSNDSSDRRRAMGRIRRAQSWAHQLVETCTSLFTASNLSGQDMAEVIIYELLLRGRFQRVREEYDTGVASLSVARSMLDELTAQAPTSHDQAIASVFIDDIAPEIRYCAHELGHKRAYDIDAIVKEVAPRNRSKLAPLYEKITEAMAKEGGRASGVAGKADKLSRLEWEGESVPLRNPELVDAFLKVEAASAKLTGTQDAQQPQQGQGGQQSSKQNAKSKKRVTAFDGILQALSDAETIARKLSEAKRLGGGGAPTSTGNTTEKERDVHFVHSFTTYQLLARRTQRDLLLIDVLVGGQTTPPPSQEKEDPRVNPAVVKLYDTVLQNLNQMRTLTVVDESTDVAAATDARIAFIRAARCLYMARTYASLKRYAEAVSLTQTAQVRLREARFQLSLLSSQGDAPETEYFPLSEEAIQRLEVRIVQEEKRMKMDWFALNGGSVKDGVEGKGKKPLFYDIAFNSIEDPLNKVKHRAGRAVEVKKPAGPSAARPGLGIATKTDGKTKSQAQVDEPAALGQGAEDKAAEAPQRSVLGSLLGGWWGRR